VVHLNGFDFGGHTSRGEGNDHTGLDNTGLDTSDGHCSNTTDLVDILKGKAERLSRWTLGAVDRVDSLEKGLTGGLATLLSLLVPT